jgi:uncharacterized protein YcfL
VKKLSLVFGVLFVLTGCSSSSGPDPSGEFEVHRVNLDDGRELECISSQTSDGYGVLDCNWETLD